MGNVWRGKDGCFFAPDHFRTPAGASKATLQVFIFYSGNAAIILR